MMMDVVSKSGLAISRKTQTEFIFKNLFTLKKNKPLCVSFISLQNGLTITTLKIILKICLNY